MKFKCEESRNYLTVGELCYMRAIFGITFQKFYEK